MALTEEERTDIRRFCGYPPRGTAGDASLDWHAYSENGLLEYRMSHLSTAELVIVRRYLPTLISLEIAVPRASESLDTDQAAVWTRNRTEVQDRLRLFDTWRRRLCDFLGVPPGRALPGATLHMVI